MKFKFFLKCYVSILMMITSYSVYAQTGDQFDVGTIEVSQDVQEIKVSVPIEYLQYYYSHNGFGDFTWSVVSVNGAVKLQYTLYPTASERTIKVTKSLLNGYDKLYCTFGYWLGGVTPYFTTLVWNFKKSSGGGGGDNIMVQNVYIYPESLSMLIGEEKTLLEIVSPVDATNQSVTWSSSNPSVATVDSEGLVKALKVGSTNIICKATDGSGKQGVCPVTVLPEGGVLTAKTKEGVEMKFHITSQADKTCAVGDKWDGKAISNNISGHITIPNIVEGYNVTEIGISAFNSCNSITSVSIPASVTIIKAFAFFNCTSLAEISGTETIKYIGMSAFDYTPFLESFPEGLVYIGKDLYCCKGELPDNTKVTVKEGTEGISVHALYADGSSNKGVVAIEIPASVSMIGYDEAVWDEGRFSYYGGTPFYCPNLQSIVIDSDNEYYESPDNCNAIIEKKSGSLIAACNNTVVPSSVKIIAKDAFSNLWGISSIRIPDNVAILGNFSYCTNLESITIGKGVEEIGRIYNCKKLKSIVVSPENKYYDSRNNCNAVIEKETSKLIIGCQNATIPSDITEIANFAFNGNGGFQLLLIPDNITTIGNAAFDNQSKLVNVVIGRNVKDIDGFAFGTFNWYGTTNVYSLNENPVAIHENAFEADMYNKGTLYVPINTKAKYKSARGWNKFENIVEFNPSTLNPDDLKVSININATNFPDANFRNYLLEQSYGKDGVITGNEIKNIRDIYVSEKNISSLKGIEFFVELEFLWCNDNQLTTLDVSENTKLKTFVCSSNQLTNLDVSKNTALSTLYCSNNKLTELDVSKNTVLTILYCDFNQLTNLDVSKNTALTELDCYLNNIKGITMDALINSLPENTSNEKHYFRAIFTTDNTYETNVCTKEQVAAVKAKGWTSQYWQSGWVEYEGSDDPLIAKSISLPVSRTVEVGDTIQLTPVFEPITAEATLTWKTEDPNIAKVTQKGVVMGIKEGTVIITVTTDNRLSADCFVKVISPSAISDVTTNVLTSASVFSLSGQRLTAPLKGVNIIGGKKVVIK